MIKYVDNNVRRKKAVCWPVTSDHLRAVRKPQRRNVKFRLEAFSPLPLVGRGGFLSMQLLIQFPFADIRKFILNSSRLEVPPWPLVQPDVDFVRSFGSVRLRKGGSVSVCGGENEICLARRGVRFTRSIVFKDTNTPFTLILRSLRLLHFDGCAVGKYELGIETNKHKINFSKDQTESFIDYFLNIPVRVPDLFGKERVEKLGEAAKSLVRLYTQASTVSNKNVKNWWVESGTPLLLLEYDIKKNSLIRFPEQYLPHEIALPSTYGIKLHYCEILYRGRNLYLWAIGLQGCQNYDIAKTLKMYLLKLHAEHQALRIVLRHLLTKKLLFNEQNETNLQNYLNDATRRIIQTEHKSGSKFSQEIVDAARRSVDFLFPGDVESVLTAIKEIRPNIYEKLVGYTNQIRADAPEPLVEEKMIETLGIPILLSAVNFLFDEAGKILQERREHREDDPGVPKKEPEKKPKRKGVVQTKEEILNLEISNMKWAQAQKEVEHLLKMLEINRDDYRLAQEQYAAHTGAYVPPVTVHILREAEEGIRTNSLELCKVLTKLYGKEIEIPDLE